MSSDTSIPVPARDQHRVHGLRHGIEGISAVVSRPVARAVGTGVWAATGGVVARAWRFYLATDELARSGDSGRQAGVQKRRLLGTTAGVVVAGPGTWLAELAATGACEFLTLTYSPWAAVLAAAGYGLRCGHATLRSLRPAGLSAGMAVEAGADLITEALRAAGIIKADGVATLAGPITSTPDGGWRVDVLLPPGYTVGMVRRADRLDRLASALVTEPPYLSVVDGGTSGSFTLTRYTTLPYTGAPVAHPLLGGARVDIARDGVPAGLDINGAVVQLDVVRGKHGLIVASSGNGKTQHLVSLLLTLGMDPATSMVLFDGKPDGTLDPLLPLLEAHVDASMDNWLVTAATLLEAEVERTRERQQRIRRGEQLGFRLIALDEFQMFTGNASAGGMKQDSPHKRIRVALAELSRLGRSARTGLALASQSYDGNTIDDETLNNIGWRLIGYAPSKMSKEALGEHADRYGLNTSTMLVDVDQAGTAVVICPGIARYALARGWYQDTKAVTAAVECAVAARRAAGVQTRPDAPAVRPAQVPAQLAAIDTLARQAAADDMPIVPTTAILDALGDRNLNAKQLGDTVTRWTGHRFDRREFRGRQLRGPRTEHILAAVDRIEAGGPIIADQTTST